MSSRWFRADRDSTEITSVRIERFTLDSVWIRYGAAGGRTLRKFPVIGKRYSYFSTLGKAREWLIDCSRQVIEQENEKIAKVESMETLS